MRDLDENRNDKWNSMLEGGERYKAKHTQEVGEGVPGTQRSLQPKGWHFHKIQMRLLLKNTGS